MNVAAMTLFAVLLPGLAVAQSRVTGVKAPDVSIFDGRDTKVLTQLIDDLVSLLHLAEHHMENEERCAHTALEARAPGASARLAQGHQRFRRPRKTSRR